MKEHKLWNQNLTIFLFMLVLQFALTLTYVAVGVASASFLGILFFPFTILLSYLVIPYNLEYVNDMLSEDLKPNNLRSWVRGQTNQMLRSYQF